MQRYQDSSTERQCNQKNAMQEIKKKPTKILQEHIKIAVGRDSEKWYGKFIAALDNNKKMLVFVY